MAKTYSAIQTQTVTGSSASSIVFTNIPQNYTDLKFAISARSTNNAHRMYLQIALNGSTSIAGLRLLGYDNNNTLSGTGQAVQVGAVPGTATGTYTFGNLEMTIPNYAANSAHHVLTHSVEEENSTVYNTIGLYSNNFSTSGAINTVTFTLDLGSFDIGSTFTLYGIGQGAKASGGTVVGSGNYIYHTFTSTGTFTPTEQIKNAEVLAVAGGGGGGGDQAGGGGAGGVLYQSGVNFTAGTPYVTSVGAGGAGASVAAAIGSQGSNSFVANVTAIGGGYGAYTSSTTGGNGGSGGGASQSTGTAGTGTAGQGNNGGSTTINTTGAGGGGAGGIGSSATSAPGGANGGNGGPGTSTYQAWHYATQTGVNVSGVYYIGGGGGGGGHSTTSTLNAGGTGGVGGGGNGGNYSNNSAARTVPTAGTANTGGGGGGEGWFGVAGDAKAGGSGLVIIRYQLA